MLNTWTEPMDDGLRGLWADKASCATIAESLTATFGIYLTRNSIIGRARRLGLEPRKPAPARNGYIRETKSGKRVIVRPRRKKTYGGEVQVIPLLPFTDLADECIPLDQRKTIFELDDRTCRWPCGDPGTPELFFCGNPEADNAAGIPYCRAHTLRACAKTVAPSVAPRRAAG